MSNPVERLVALYGSQRALGSVVGRSQPTVAGWVRTGLVPAEHQLPILLDLRRRGCAVGPEIFFPPLPPLRREAA